MSKFSCVLTILCFGFFHLAPAQAATPNFNALSQADFDAITLEFSANTNLHDVMPASSMGSIFGFELGLEGGLTRSPNTNAIVQRASPSTDVSSIPHAGILGALTVPLGITVEASVVPAITASTGSYSQYAVAAKWTATDILLPDLPINLAIRGFYSSMQLSFSQTINNSSTANTPVNATLSYKGSVTGFHFMVSPKFLPIVEPYAALGFVSGNGQLDVAAASASATIFPGFPSGANTSATSSSSSSHFILGANVKLLVFVLGAEYARAFGTDTYTGKLSLRF